MAKAKVLVTLDDRLVKRLDEEAKLRGLSRSALISWLAAKELGVPVGPGADPKVHEAIRKLRELGKFVPPGDITQWIREDRDSHY